MQQNYRQTAFITLHLTVSTRSGIVGLHTNAMQREYRNTFSFSMDFASTLTLVRTTSNTFETNRKKNNFYLYANASNISCSIICEIIHRNGICGKILLHIWNCIALFCLYSVCAVFSCTSISATPKSSSLSVLGNIFL